MSMFAFKDQGDSTIPNDSCQCSTARRACERAYLSSCCRGHERPTNEEEAADAANDRQIAKEQWHIPPSLYERIAIRVEVEPPIDLLDLREVSVRNRFRNLEVIMRELRSAGFSQLDRGALLSPHRTLTQAVTGAVLRGQLSSETIGGLLAESRHAGDIVVVFSGDPYRPHLRVAENVPLTKHNINVISVAKELELAY